MNTANNSSLRVTPQIILGLLIVAFGVILTLDNLDYVEAGHIFGYWLLLLVAFGLARILGSDCTSSRVSGGAMILIGLWLSADSIWGVPLDFERWWPMILVAVGGLILFRAFRGGGDTSPDTHSTTDSVVSEVAVWAGKVRRISSPMFRRADLTAIMGGVEVDLRGAATGGQEAVIDVFAWWGGMDITVPPDWAVSNQVVVFMGGVDDSSSGTQDSRNRLVLRGFVVMGGVEIKTSRDLMATTFGDRRRLQFHLIAWGLVGALLALLAHNGFEVRWTMALAFGIPLGLLAAPLSFSAWFMARAMPLTRTAAWQLVISAVIASVIAGGVWASVGRWWWRFLGRFGVPGEAAATPAFVSLLLGFGALAYLLSVTVQYALQATEDSAGLAQRDLQLQIAAREAELRALRAQVDPHFLFNSLNAVSGLIGSDPERAREMVQRLADFLRSSLTLGKVPWIALERELALVSSYLEIERVRFGERLSVRVEMDDGLGGVQVPPLLLQPLVENAVRHGIATCLEGGTIQVEARRRGDVVWLTVTNPRDGESTRRGTGFGLDIVRRRLSGAFGTRAALAVEPSPTDYRVSITWPIGLEDPSSELQPPLRVVIVDDEELARLTLRQHLTTLGNIEIVSECTNGFEAIKAASELKPDVMLLDVQMPKIDGFEVLEVIGRDIPVVFVTAYDEFALRAFEVHAVDYLLKPFTAARLGEALERVRSRQIALSVPAGQLRAAARKPGSPLDRVIIRDGADVHVLVVGKIDYVEAQDDYVSFKTAGKSLLKEQTLADLESQLDPRRFVRIHRSYLLNIDRLAKVELYAKDSREAILQDGTRLPVSRSGYQRLQQLL